MKAFTLVVFMIFSDCRKIWSDSIVTDREPSLRIIDHQRPWNREKISPLDHLEFDSEWKFSAYPGVDIPVTRAPYPTFGMVWPLPHTWTATQRFYSVDWAHLNLDVTGVNNYILKAAVARYSDLISDRTGLSVYPIRWSHVSSHLPKFAQVYQSISSSHDKFMTIGNAGGNENFSEKSTAFWSGKNLDLLRKLFEAIKPDYATPHYGPIRNILVHVRSAGSAWPSLQMDESYAVLVDSGRIMLLANETWGALRGLESLSQLMWTTADYTQVFINQTYVIDKPRFKHRGLLLDTSRHFISKAVIMLNLEAMAYNKMNVFHWHFVDDHSYPYASQRFPELSKKGAFYPSHVYTFPDIKEIIEFARLRGIRVIPEFDIPGHTRSMAYSKPELLAQCWTDSNVFFGPLNVYSNETYLYLEQLLEEVISLFPDEFVHLGGDEVEFACWNNDVAMDKVRSQLHTAGGDLEYFWRRVQNIVTQLGNKDPKKSRKLIMWEEAFHHVAELSQSAATQVWQAESADELTAIRDIIYSKCWYLDHFTNVKEWDQFYLCDPVKRLNMETDSQIKKVLGGEACMWSEYQNDDTVLQKIWPITSAIAERLWSRSSVNDPLTVGPRIEEQRCRLISRGIPQSVLLGPGSCPNSGALFSEPTTKTTIIHHIQTCKDLKNCSSSPPVQFRSLISINGFSFFLFGFLLGVVITMCFDFARVQNIPTTSRLLPRRQSLTRFLCSSLIIIIVITFYNNLTSSFV